MQWSAFSPLESPLCANGLFFLRTEAIRGQRWSNGGILAIWISTQVVAGYLGGDGVCLWNQILENASWENDVTREQTKIQAQKANWMKREN